MNERQPWTDWTLTAASLNRARERWMGRALYRATAGPGWLRLNLEGDERPGLLLVHRPGALLCVAGAGRLPDPVHRALSPSPKHPLTALLAGCTLAGLGLLPDDRVVAVRLEKPDGSALFLLLQMFGARGNLVLLDADSRLLWAAHRPPHSLLAATPEEATWATGDARSGADSPADGFAADAVSAAALEHLADRLAAERAGAVGAALRRRAQAARRLADNLESDLARASRGDEYRRIGETLAAHLHEIRAGMSQVTLSDPRDGSDVEIELDPAKPPAANLEAWFRKARKADKGREIIEQRLEEASAEAHLLEEALADFEVSRECESGAFARLTAVQEWTADHADLLPAGDRGRRRTRAEEPARPFRRYLVDGRWEVWVGRSNKENDELTFGASHGRDIWLHAQGVPGSHVILRTAGKPEQVPRTIIEKAAALAALHCRSKHSSLVPVIWTERRYVRKPRKSAPGTATCLREKSLFVEPGVPAGAEPT